MKKMLTFFATIPLLAFTISNPGGLFPSFGNNSIGGITLALINLLLGIVGILSIFFIIYGGFQYITSRGNEEQADSGKKTLTNAIMGLVIVLLSYVIVVVIINALKGKT
jgi:uncharacterized membrane protein